MIAADLKVDRKTGLIFDEFPARAFGALLARITSLTQDLESRVSALVPVASGELRGLVQSFVDATPDRIAGKVKLIAKSPADFGKAAALEYGAHQSTRVKAHVMRLDHIYAQAIAPLQVSVAAYSRTPNIAEHRFLRGPLAAMQQLVLDQLHAAIAEVASE